jgi:hypothetical protein
MEETEDGIGLQGRPQAPGKKLAICPEPGAYRSAREAKSTMTVFSEVTLFRRE